MLKRPNAIYAVAYPGAATHKTTSSARQSSADSYHKHSGKGRNMTDKQPAALAAHTEHHLEMVGRWYMLNKMGMATLCMSKKDAEQEAADAQSVWPHMGPHRAVRLVEASFEAADMATAAADGFRSAAAEVAKLRGQRRVLCDLLSECLPIIDAMLQLPGDDDSDARLYGLISRIKAAQAAVAEEALEGCRA